MNYAAYLLKKEREQAAFRQYLADCVYAINVNAAGFGGGSGVSVTWAEYSHPKPPDNRTGEQIAFDVIKAAGLEVIMD